MLYMSTVIFKQENKLITMPFKCKKYTVAHCNTAAGNILFVHVVFNVLVIINILYNVMSWARSSVSPAETL